jgi:hypothetical protein
MAKLNSVEGAAISGAAVKLAGTNTSLSVTTDASGNFTFSNIANGTYTVTITKANYTFVPPEISVTVSGKDVVVQTFVGTTSGGTPGGNTGTGGSATYFPLKLGATWTFESSESEDSSYNFVYIDKVVGTMAQGGKTYWMYETSYPSEYYSYSDTTLFRIENNTLYGFMGMDFFTKPVPKSAKARAAKIASVAKATVFAYGSELPILKFGVSAGTSWTIYDSGVIQGNSMKVTARYLGTESVTVPAGTFSNCAKYEMTYVTTYKDPDSSTTETYSDINTTWFAPNVGNVKGVSVSNNDGDTYSSTDVLKSYSIP